MFMHLSRAVLGLIAVGFLALPIGTLSAKQPNILLIVGDDMGYADVGFHGGKDIPTTNLDALAASGVRFTSGYVSGPYCSPTRAGLLTGRYQNRFGHEFNPGDGQVKGGLPLDQSTLADRLKAAGYRTGLVGKWHLGGQPEYHPQQRGFEEFFGFLVAHTVTYKPKAYCVAKNKSQSWITRPMRLRAKLYRSSTRRATNLGFCTWPSTPFTRRWTPPVNDWLSSHTFKILSDASTTP